MALSESLAAWDSTEQFASLMLTKVVRELLSSFSEYQSQRLQSMPGLDSKLRFEVDTLLGRSNSTGVQAMCTPSTATFVVDVGGDGLDLGDLLPASAAAEAVQALQQACKLSVAFPLRAGPSASAAPAVSLHLPALLQDLLGRVELPHWPQSSMCTVEYVPQVRQRLQEACDAAAAALSARRSLLHALNGSALGPLLECDADFFCTCSFQLHRGGASWLVSVDVPPSFPQQPPRLTLQGGQEEESKSLTRYKWDPSWTGQEMAAHLQKVILGEASL